MDKLLSRFVLPEGSGALCARPRVPRRRPGSSWEGYRVDYERPPTGSRPSPGYGLVFFANALRKPWVERFAKDRSAQAVQKNPPGRSYANVIQPPNMSTLRPVGSSTSDLSQGWEAVADRFAALRSDVGADVVLRWAAGLPTGGSVVDIGCGTGRPIAVALVGAGRGWRCRGSTPPPPCLPRFAMPCPVRRRRARRRRIAAISGGVSMVRWRSGCCSCCRPRRRRW